MFAVATPGGVIPPDSPGAVGSLGGADVFSKSWQAKGALRQACERIKFARMITAGFWESRSDDVA